MNATINTNMKGQLALTGGGLRRTPNLTVDAVAAWEEIISETPGAGGGAASKIGQAVARASLPGIVGKAASAAVGSALDSSKGGKHTVRVDWADGKQSLIELPDKLFQHLAILLKDCQIQTASPPATAPTPAPPSGMIGHLAKLAGTPTAQPDVVEQIAKLAALRDAGALTDEEFTAKKTELLDRI